MSDAGGLDQAALAPYLEAELTFGPLVITPGVRLDPYALSVSRRLPREGGTPPVGLFEQNFAIEPRLSLRLPRCWSTT